MYSAHAGEARTGVLYGSNSAVPWCLPWSMQVSTIAVGRDAGDPRTAVRPSGSDHRMSGLIGRLISHLAQKYIVEALGSTSALSEP